MLMQVRDNLDPAIDSSLCRTSYYYFPPANLSAEGRCRATTGIVIGVHSSGGQGIDGALHVSSRVVGLTRRNKKKEHAFE